MNLLLLTYQGNIAGSTNSIAYLAQGLAARGHTVVVGLPAKSLLYKMLEGSAVIRLPMHFNSKISLKNMREIRNAVQQYNIQIINAQSSKDRYTSVFARCLYKLPVKIVHTRRQKPESSLGRLQTWFYTHGTDKIIAISPQLKQTLVEKGFPPNHIQVIMNGLPPQHFAPINPHTVAALRRRFGIQAHDIVIGCIARPKKQEQILQALPHLNNPHIKLLFAGIAPGSLHNWVQQLQLSNPIIYAGIVPGSQIMNYYPLCTLCILPSDMDGFGLSLVEAMAAGIPVIGTRAQGIIDVLDNEKNGLWFEDGDVQELAQKIKLILSDDALRQQLIDNGKHAAATTFSLTRTLNEYEQFFGQLLST